MSSAKKKLFFIIIGCVAFFALSACSSVRKGVIQGTDQGAPSALVQPGPGQELLTLKTTSGTEIAALLSLPLNEKGQPMRPEPDRPLILYFYAGGHTLQRSREVIDGFRRLGCAVLVPEYPGFGMSRGTPSEKGCYEAADAAYAYIIARPDLTGAGLVAVGWSVGGGVAVDLAARKPLAGLVLVGTSTRISDVLVGLSNQKASTAWIPGWVMGSLSSQCKLDSLSKMPAVGCRTMIVYGEKDELVTKEMAQRLAAAAKPGVWLQQAEGAGHTTFFRSREDPLWNELALWLSSPASHALAE